MNRTEFITILDNKLRLIRNEKDFTQDKMAEIIGVSKKTLVQIEKGRSSLGWTGAVAVAVLFKDSDIIQMALGGNPHDLVLSLAFNSYEDNYEPTLGGKVWWKNTEQQGNYIVQQNIISQHYRILDQQDRRVCSSFDLAYIQKRLLELCEREG